MRIAIGSDHAGFRLKQVLVDQLSQEGYQFIDEGTNGPDSVDYPDYAHPVADAVLNGTADLGLLLCGSGNGVNITANKHKGIRAALAWLPEVAALAREHNNANVLSLPARYLTDEEALAVVHSFLNARFEGGRHQRRVEKIEATTPVPDR
ncbi:MAG: ribose 5-phosphate isomerase B [Flavobacteriales bacterium]